MLTLCSKCNKLLQEGDKVAFVMAGTYHDIPSTKHWAISKEGLEADVRSIRHLNCPLEG